MSMNDTISDLLTRVRNGQMSNKKSVSVPYSKMKESICKVMLDEGYIDGYSSDEGKIRTLVVELKYFEGRPVIDYIKRDKLSKATLGGCIIEKINQTVVISKE